MDANDEKDVLGRYLSAAREAVLWKLEGLSEYDVRRPVTPTGTNLLGLVKHLGMVEWGYFGFTFGRSFPIDVPWDPAALGDNEDMYASADESREMILDFYKAVTKHADETIEDLALDDTGRVPWWPPDVNEVTLQRILVHLIAETNRHGGHADIVREQIDGEVGLRSDVTNLPDLGATGWQAHFDHVEGEARRAAQLD